jgi:AcrR family transcriptional regulator
MANSKSSDERPYHHGDLRRAIVTAAVELLSETQSVDFSLRELARRAGVSHNAPYKHFADKSELLAAVSAAGFDLLATGIAEQIERIGNPRAQLFVMLRIYIRFGVDNPALTG